MNSRLKPTPRFAEDQLAYAEKRAKTSSMRRRATTGSVWTGIGSMAGNVLRLGGNLIVTRLVMPELFGLAAIVSTIVIGLTLMSDVGLGPAIVQSNRGGDRRFLDTAWTIQVIRGIFLSLAAAAMAWPIARFYGDERLLGLVPFAGIGAILGGLNSTNIHTATRDLQLARLTILNLTAQAIGISVMIAWALLVPSVWALVAGGLTISLAQMILSHTFLHGERNHFAWDPTAVDELFHFGKWIFANTGLYFWATQGDRILLGKLATLTLVGIYQVGFNLAQPIVMITMQLSQSVFLPMFSEAWRQNPGRLRQVYYRTRMITDLTLVPAIGIAIVISQPVVDFLYDPRYRYAGMLLQIFFVHAAIKCVVCPAESCVLAIGIPRSLTVAGIVRTVGVLAGIPIGFSLNGLEGVAWAICLVEVVMLTVIWRCLRERKILDPLREWLAVAGLAAGYGTGLLLKAGLVWLVG